MGPEGDVAEPLLENINLATTTTPDVCMRSTLLVRTENGVGVCAIVLFSGDQRRKIPPSYAAFLDPPLLSTPHLVLYSSYMHAKQCSQCSAFRVRTAERGRAFLNMQEDRIKLNAGRAKFGLTLSDFE